MERYQTGEVMLVMMVVILVIWLANGHMGMMGMMHGAGHDKKTAATEQQTKSEPALPTAPKESPEHQH